MRVGGKKRKLFMGGRGEGQCVKGLQ
jgi:hypothetical protein